jgi:hypothetical protein
MHVVQGKMLCQSTKLLVKRMYSHTKQTKGRRKKNVKEILYVTFESINKFINQFCSYPLESVEKLSKIRFCSSALRVDHHDKIVHNSLVSMYQHGHFETSNDILSILSYHKNNQHFYQSNIFLLILF